MKVVKLLAGSVLGLLFLAGSVSAETWIGSCNGIQLNFDRDAKRILLYMKTDKGTFQVGKGKITFDNGTALRGSLIGNTSGTGKPLNDVGMNKSRNTIYLLHYDMNSGQPNDGGVFCKTEVRVN